MYVCMYVCIWVYIIFGFSWVKRLVVRIASRSVVPPQPSRGIVIRPILAQTVSFRLWYDPIPIISILGLYNLDTLFHSHLLLIFFRNSEKGNYQHFESLCHKWLNELCQNISTLKSTLFWSFKKNSQCNMTEFSATLQNYVCISF